MSRDDEQESKAAQSIECRTIAGGKIILIVQFAGSAGGWHWADRRIGSAMTIHGASYA